VTPTYTYTQTFNVVDFADPYLQCDQCRGWVTGWAPDSDAPGLLFPCEHSAGLVYACPSWGPVDGCQCNAYLGYKPHGEPQP